MTMMMKEYFILEIFCLWTDMKIIYFPCVFPSFIIHCFDS